MLASCAGPAPDYQTLPGGSRWKLVAFGEQTTKLDSASLVQISAEVFLDGSVPLRLEGKSYLRTADDLWLAFSSLYVGDSIEFLSSSPDFLRPADSGMDTLLYRIGISRMRTRRQLEDARLMELSLLDALIKTDSVQSNYREYEGVWIRTLIPGDTMRVREGREVVVHYQGRTTQGDIFDDSRNQDGPLRFVMGQEHQVISGIEIALERLHRGETAELILPSWLAFGSKGSIGGLVPPFATVIYQVEVLDVSDE